MEHTPQTKADEQYPLLKVDSGGGDGGIQRTEPATVSPAWSVAHTTRQSWFTRWPEYVSACWMTIILLGISLLVFYAVGMEAYRRQPILILKCNSSKPATDVIYHQMVRGNNIPFLAYSEYLSHMAERYPKLHFHVYFLLDDSYQPTMYRGPRHARLFNNLIPTSGFDSLDDFTKCNSPRFMKLFPNVNHTIIPLSKYMAMTPLKYKWRNIPLPYVLFYARIYSVWQNGGVAMDLNTYNYYFSRRQVDPKITAILRQHNDGIKVEDYKNALNKINRDEGEFLSFFFEILHQFLNETRSFLYKSSSVSQGSNEKGASNSKSLVRMHRNKRDMSTPAIDAENKTDNGLNTSLEITNSSYTNFNTEEHQSVNDFKNNTGNTTINAVLNSTASIKLIHEDSGKLDTLNNKTFLQENVNRSESPQMIFFYDFSIISEGLPPVIPSSESKTVDNNAISYLLSIDSDGTFIAASSRFHPFLSHLMSAGCHRMNPKIAIRDTLLTQCAGFSKEDTYCNNIYLL